MVEASVGFLSRTLDLPFIVTNADGTQGQIFEARSDNDPTASIDQGHALFELIARSTADSRMYIFNRAGHFSYREHPAEFNEMLRGFIERIV